MCIYQYAIMKGEEPMNRVVREKPMKEILYRESRVAKALGEPSKYAIVSALLKHGPMNVLKLLRRCVVRSQQFLIICQDLEV